eukprot:51460-Chlamydomonas_euryale.AAC.3
MGISMQAPLDKNQFGPAYPKKSEESLRRERPWSALTSQANSQYSGSLDSRSRQSQSPSITSRPPHVPHGKNSTIAAMLTPTRSSVKIAPARPSLSSDFSTVTVY